MSILFKKPPTENKPNSISIRPDFSGVEEVEEVNNGSQIIEETVKTPTVEQTTDNKGNFNRLLDHVSTPRPKVESNPNTRRKIEEETEEIDNEISQDPETETETDNKEKQSPEFYKAQGEFAADMTDIAVPNAIAWLNDETDETPYCAEHRIKKQIAEAYGRFFEDKGKQLSPTGQLVTALAMGYGIPLGMASFGKVMKMMNSYKDKKIELEQLELERLRKAAAQPTTENQNGATPNPTPNPKPTPEPKQETPPPTPAPEPEKKEPIIEPKTEIRKDCLHENCNKSFVEFEGYGRTKKSKYYDQFCSEGCMRSFASNIGLKARQKNKAADKKEDPKAEKKPAAKKPAAKKNNNANFSK
jgi:hypothetical protein